MSMLFNKREFDFFVYMYLFNLVFMPQPFQRLIGVEDEDSCGKSSLCETPQACRGGSRATRGKRSLPRKSKAVLRNTN
jgi:hypothetical protein